MNCCRRCTNERAELADGACADCLAVELTQAHRAMDRLQRSLEAVCDAAEARGQRLHTLQVRTLIKGAQRP